MFNTTGICMVSNNWTEFYKLLLIPGERRGENKERFGKDELLLSAFLLDIAKERGQENKKLASLYG